MGGLGWGGVGACPDLQVRTRGWPGGRRESKSDWCLKGRIEGEFLVRKLRSREWSANQKNIGLSPFLQKQIGLPSIAVIRRIGPILGVVAKAMLDRVGPAIVHMGAEIGFVADVMFPESLLPDRGFVPPGLNRAVT